MITLEDYVPFEIAKILREKGFNWPCHATYDTAVTGGKPKFSEYEVLNFFPYGMKNTNDKYGMVISAPTLQMAMKWLREVHNIFIAINIVPHATITMEQKYYFFKLYKDRRAYNFSNDSTKLYSSYEEACEAAIKYCLENLI